MKKIIAGLVLSAGCATSAMAAEPGPYVSVEYGPATYSNAPTFPNPGVLRLAGGMNFNPNFGAELGLSVFGSSSISGPGGTASIDSATSVQFLAVGRVPLGTRFELFGKVGLAANSYTLNANIPGLIVGSASYSQSALMYGVGGKFDVTPNFGIEAEYLDYGAFDSTSLPLKASSITVGAVFSF